MAFSTLQDKINSIIEEMDELTPHVGCGDNSCLFVKSTGMSTNGGCRCFKHHDMKPFQVSALALIYRAAMRLKGI